MTQRNFYEEAEEIAFRLWKGGDIETYEQLNNAIAGGATSGEILSDILVALRELKMRDAAMDPETEAMVDRLTQDIEMALQ